MRGVLPADLVGRFSSFLTAFAGWRLEYMTFNSVNTSTIAALGGFRRRGVLSGPSAGVTFDNTEDPFNPHSGEIISLLGNFSDHTFGADYCYWRVLSELRKYQLLRWQTVLATRLKVGLSDSFSTIGDVPLSERFYSGGEGSVRGYGLRRIGPLSASDDPLGGLSLVEGSALCRRASLCGRVERGQSVLRTAPAKVSGPTTPANLLGVVATAHRRD